MIPVSLLLYIFNFFINKRKGKRKERKRVGIGSDH